MNLGPEWSQTVHNGERDFPVTLPKEKWSTRQLRAYELHQKETHNRKNQKRKRDAKGRGLIQEKNAKARVRKAEKLNQERMLRTYDRKVQGFDDDEGDIHVNKLWSQFYEAQKDMLKNREEFLQFVRAMSTPLPVTFRVEDTSPVYFAAKTRLDSEEFKFIGKYIVIQGRVLSKNLLEPLRVLPHAWKINIGRSGLQRTQEISPLYKFLTREVSLGHISRQEVASMVPVKLLESVMIGNKQNVSEPTILDTCCCPGSKTRQMLSVIRSSFNGRGCLVANDSDSMRLKSMRKQMNRMGSDNLILTCERGEDLLDKMGPHAFDYVYSDVPCTGDGTFRKAPALWPKWHPANALAMHRLQLQIALHSYSMVKVGGYFVYSTCSLNPLENEAVVATLIETSAFSCDVIAIDDLLSQAGLKVSSGLVNWTLDEDKDREGIDSNHSILPPSKRGLSPKKVMRIERRLKNSVRLTPHISNTGGFFVAVIKKNKEYTFHPNKDGDERSNHGRPTPGVEEIDEKQALTILQHRMGFKAASSKESKLDECLFDCDKKELENMQNLLQLTCIKNRTKALITTSSSSSKFEIYAENDKPFHLITRVAKDMLETLLSSNVTVLHAGIAVLTRQAPNVENMVESFPKLSHFYRACEYCFVPDGVTTFVSDINTRKFCMTVRDFALIIHMHLNSSTTSEISAQSLSGRLSSSAFAVLMKMKVGSSYVFYLDSTHFDGKQKCDEGVANDAAIERQETEGPRTSYVPADRNGGGKKRVKRRKVKKIPPPSTNSTEKVASLYLGDVKNGKCQPMCIVIFSLGEVFHILTPNDRLRSYIDYVQTCLPNPFANDEFSDDCDEINSSQRRDIEGDCEDESRSDPDSA